MDAAEQLADLLLPHLERPVLHERMAAFYAAVDAAISAYQPVCRNRGACCRFDSFGHKLYVTTLELAYFLHGCGLPWPLPLGDACPFQVAGRCITRSYRPLGCRIFYCDPDMRDWQGPEYESRLMELRRMSEELAIPYRYLEWLSALRRLHPPQT